MLVRAMVLGLVVTLGACSEKSGEKTVSNTAVAGAAVADTPVAANGAVANYVPPTVTSRADYGGTTERRFHKLDANGDDRLSLAELPGRNAQRLLDRYDKDGNKLLDSSEWGALMLERFDRLDANKDGSVTSEERQAMRGKRKARAGAAGAIDDDAM